MAWICILAHIPEWLARKAGVLGCTSSHTILCWKETFPNEDATRFDLVDELYTLPAKMPTSMFQFAAWLEDSMTPNSNVHNNRCQRRQLFLPLSPSLKAHQRRTNQFADSFSNQMDARMETIGSTHIRALMVSVCGVALSPTISRLVPVRGDSSLLDLTA